MKFQALRDKLTSCQHGSTAVMLNAGQLRELLELADTALNEESLFELVATVQGSGSSWDPIKRVRASRDISIDNEGPSLGFGTKLYRRKS